LPMVHGLFGNRSNMAEVISLVELVESRLKKQQELDYYIEVLQRLQLKVSDLQKEINVTSIIIDMIENERVLSFEEKRDKIVQLEIK
jgi:hypothetical protein